MSLRAQAAARSGLSCDCQKTFGSKLSKMIYANSQVIGKQVEVVDTSAHERNQFSLTDAEIQSWLNKR